MSDSNQTGKKKLSKGLIATIATIVVLIGGAVAAMFLNSSSPKATYFKAEADTIDFLVEQLKERYEPELSFNEKTMEQPSEATIELSANYNGPPEIGLGMDPGQIINNSTITLVAQSDMKNKEASASLSANVAGMNFEDFNFYVTGEDITAELPFVDELLQIKDEEFGTLLHELDPYTFTGEEKLNLDSIFENPYGGLTEEQEEHFKTEYAEMIYKELSEDAFTSSKEKIEVLDESINAEKIELKLSEDEVKELITLVLNKMKSDEVLKQLIEDELALQSFGAPELDYSIEEVLSEFENGIDEAIEELADFQIPGGLNSTIWIHDGLVVQRDFSIEMGPNSDDLVQFAITGSQLFTETSQEVDYEFAFSDNYDEGSLFIDGGFNWEDNKGDDKITISAEDVSIIYEASESLENNSREFERKISFDDGFEKFGINWDGVANFDNDQVSSGHTISFEIPGIPSDMVSLQLDVEGKMINGVELPENDNVLNLGTMTAEELISYFESLEPAFQEWLESKLMSGGMGF